MENESDYYFIGSTIPTPRLVNDDSAEGISTAFLSLSSVLPTDYVTYLRFGQPIPSKPNLNVDLLPLEGNWRVFSKKVVDSVANYHFKGLQFVPVIITGFDNQINNAFYIANTYLKLASFDPDKTEYDGISRVTGAWRNIEKIVLDHQRLNRIPLEDRLVFVSSEHPGFILYHKIIVDAIMSANPEGISFTPVEEWNDSF